MGWDGWAAAYPDKKKTRIERQEIKLASLPHVARKGLPRKNTAITRVADEVV